MVCLDDGIQTVPGFPAALLHPTWALIDAQGAGSISINPARNMDDGGTGCPDLVS